MAAGEAALQAVYPDARNPFAHPRLLADEGLQEWSVDTVWVMGREDPDHFVDITEQLPHKLGALAAHESQTAHLDDLEAMITDWGSRLARRAGLAEGRLAEAYTVIDTR